MAVRIRLAEYALLRTKELVNHIIAVIDERIAVLLPNHRAIDIGGTIHEAFTVCELLEKTAKIYLCTLAPGKVNPMLGNRCGEIFLCHA